MKQQNYPNTPYQRWLETHYACQVAREWVAAQTPAEAWLACPRADWMLWQVARCNPPEELRPALVKLANGFADALDAEAAAWEDEEWEARVEAADVTFGIADKVRSALPPVLPKLNEE